jgi:hypothetical protein
MDVVIEEEISASAENRTPISQAVASNFQTKLLSPYRSEGLAGISLCPLYVELSIIISSYRMERQSALQARLRPLPKTDFCC